jgi:hypothetical protein
MTSHASLYCTCRINISYPNNILYPPLVVITEHNNYIRKKCFIISNMANITMRYPTFILIQAYGGII